MKATLKAQSIFYQNLGKAFYAIAAADKRVHQDEIETLKQIVNSDWVALEGQKTPEEIDTMRQIKRVFYELVQQNADAKKCMKEFEDYKRANENLFNAEIKQILWKTANEIASSFSKKNKSELIVLADLFLLLK